MPNAKRHPTNIDRPTKKRQKSQRFVKLKEVQANAQSQRFCSTFNFTQRTQAHPPPKQVDKLVLIDNIQDNRIKIGKFTTYKFDKK